MDLSYRTAQKRRKLSAPTRYLLNKGLLVGRKLDFGCGYGRDAIETLSEMYDPHFFPSELKGKFDTIYCNFVLNVVEDEDIRAFVLLRIGTLLSNKGIAYITVRNDVKELKGFTKRGTWQGLIELDLPIEKKGAHWTMYRLTARQTLLR